MYVDWDRPHLGGYLKGGDPGSYCPGLWSWLIEEQSVRSMLDVGCGEGQAISYFRDRGCRVLGIDGIAQDDPDIVEHDFTLGRYRTRRRFDLCWCCEFVEHVEEQFIPNFLALFAAAEMLLMTHAQSGQGGHHHVNCQSDYYWIERLERIGFKFDLDLTRETHARVSPNHYYAWSGLAFRRL
jgi:SAM-dependent methyltransferase